MSPSAKKVSLKGLADFMTSSAVRQRSILRQYKHPDEDEARAKIIYYREARDRIAAYHRSNHPADWLNEQASSLAGLAASSDGRTRTRLQHNVRGLRAYASHFSRRRFDLLPDVTHYLTYGDVTVTVRPDLHVRERRKEKLVKLEFGVEDPPDQLLNIIAQSMFEAAENAGLGLSSACIICLDVPRGREIRGARAGSRMRSEIQAACANISSIWETI